MKSYRDRNLTQMCQLAQVGPDGEPVLTPGGEYALEFGGLWFLKVSGHDGHERKRLVPEDPGEFFALKAREMEAALAARGAAGRRVTPEDVYREYERHFTNPSHTYAPPGRPEEFSLVLDKRRCVNWRGGAPRGSSAAAPADLAPERMSVFARLLAAGPAEPGAEEESAPPAESPRPRGRGRSAARSEAGPPQPPTTLAEMGFSDY